MGQSKCSNCLSVVAETPAKFDDVDNVCEKCLPLLVELVFKNVFMQDVPNVMKDGNPMDVDHPTLPIRVMENEVFSALNVGNFGAKLVTSSLLDKGWIATVAETARGAEYCRTEKGVQEFGKLGDRKPVEARKKAEEVRRVADTPPAQDEI